MLKILYFLNVCFAFALCISYLSPWVNPELFEYISLFGLLFPIFLFANVLFAIFWIFTKTKYAFLSVLCILLGWNSIGGLMQLGHNELSQDGNVKVMSYNVRGLHLSPSNKKIVQEMTDYFQQENEVEIYCIQEKRSAKKSVLNQMFLGMNTIESEYGMAIFSKFPFKDQGKIAVGGNTGEAVWADIIHPNGKIFRVYSYHLSSNLISSRTDDLIEAADSSEEIWTGLKGILRSYTTQAIKRKKQLDILLAHIRKSPYPVIAAGDMNDVAQSYAYRSFRKILADSFRLKGQGLGVSFGEKYPLLRIDYIFHDKEFAVHQHKVDKVQFSDHFPVYSQLNFN